MTERLSGVSQTIINKLGQVQELLESWQPKTEHQKKMKTQAEIKLNSLIIHLGTTFIDANEWNDVYLFLIECGIQIPDEINQEMILIEEMDKN